jgi:hypothetical protein
MPDECLITGAGAIGGAKINKVSVPEALEESIRRRKQARVT